MEAFDWELRAHLAHMAWKDTEESEEFETEADYLAYLEEQKADEDLDR